MSRRIFFASLFGIGGILLALFISTRTPVTPAGNLLSEQEEGTVATSSLSLTPLDWNATSTEGTDDITLRETEMLTRNVLGPYFSESSQGTYNEDVANTIIARAAEDATTLVYTPLTTTAVITSVATSTERVLQYKNELYEALQPVFALEEYELTIYARATEQNSATDFEKLTQYARVYRSTADALRAISAPGDAATIHVAILNSMYHFAVMLDALAAGFDDPARSISGIANFNAVESEFTRSFANLRTYFVLKDVAE